MFHVVFLIYIFIVWYREKPIKYKKYKQVSFPAFQQGQIILESFVDYRKCICVFIVIYCFGLFFLLFGLFYWLVFFIFLFLLIFLNISFNIKHNTHALKF